MAGLHHVEINVSDLDRSELPTLLAERGVEVLYADRSADEIGAPSSYSVFFEDPDRIKVGVITPEER